MGNHGVCGAFLGLQTVCCPVLLSFRYTVVVIYRCATTSLNAATTCDCFSADAGVKCCKLTEADPQALKSALAQARRISARIQNIVAGPCTSRSTKNWKQPKECKPPCIFGWPQQAPHSNAAGRHADQHSNSKRSLGKLSMQQQISAPAPPCMCGPLGATHAGAADTTCARRPAPRETGSTEHARIRASRPCMRQLPTASQLCDRKHMHNSKSCSEKGANAFRSRQNGACSRGCPSCSPASAPTCRSTAARSPARQWMACLPAPHNALEHQT